MIRLFSAMALAVLTALGGAPEPVVAQTEDSTDDPLQERRFEGRLEVSEVLFDVVVTDRDGHLVTGLDAEDFVVVSDGREASPTSVSFYSTRYGTGSNDEIPASRYFIFFFHDQRRAAGPGNQLLQQQLLAGRQSVDWVTNDMGPSDWIAVVSYDVKLQVHQDFTQDRPAIVRAIEQAVRGGDPERESRRRRPGGDHTEASLLRRLPRGLELRDETANIHRAVSLLAEASGHVVGRKNLLFFTIGFGEIRREAIALPDRRYYPAMEEALNASNVAVYPIDLTPRGADHSQSHFLNTLADDTGGAYIQFFTSFATPLRQVAKEASGYYLLGYRAEHQTGESGYHEVEIRTRDKGLVVRAPKGYRYGH